MFFKSIDHTLTRGTENENSQMFFNISSRNIKNILLYASFFIDEFSKSRIGDPKRTNFVSYKGGLKTSNFLIQNICFTAEYTQTKPMTFKHRVPSLTFETTLQAMHISFLAFQNQSLRQNLQMEIALIII